MATSNPNALSLVDVLINSARVGNATLAAGTKDVTLADITANSVVILTRKSAGGALGNLTYTISAGVKFTINSDSGTDTSVVSYLVIN